MEKNQDIRIEGSALSLDENLKIIDGIFLKYRKLFIDYYSSKGQKEGCAYICVVDEDGKRDDSSFGDASYGIVCHLDALKDILLKSNNSVSPAFGGFVAIMKIANFLTGVELSETEQTCLNQIVTILDEFAKQEINND